MNKLLKHNRVQTFMNPVGILETSNYPDRYFVGTYNPNTHETLTGQHVSEYTIAVKKYDLLTKGEVE